jgi:hypothetical protein
LGRQELFVMSGTAHEAAEVTWDLGTQCVLVVVDPLVYTRDLVVTLRTQQDRPS